MLYRWRDMAKTMGLRVIDRIVGMSHYVAGLISAAAAHIDPMLSLITFLIFLFYELDEEWNLRDAAHEELLEYAIGFYIGLVLLLLL